MSQELTRIRMELDVQARKIISQYAMTEEEIREQIAAAVQSYDFAGTIRESVHDHIQKSIKDAAQSYFRWDGEGKVFLGKIVAGVFEAAFRESPE